jgi:ribose transport system substrate-binding protein
MKYPASFLATLCASLILLNGCGRPPVSSELDGESPIRIAVIPKATTHSYWKAAEAGARQAAEELGLRIEWQGPLDDSRIADQITIFNNLAASGVNGIVLAPTDDRGLVSHVRNARRRGVPVVIFDSPLEGEAGTDFVSFIATDNKAAGSSAAEELGRLIETPQFGGSVLMIRFTEGSASTRLREEGFTGTLAQDARLRIIAQQFTDGSMAGAQRVAETLLGNHVRNNRLELDGIFASNQPTAEGTLNALRSLRNRGVEVRTRFVGFDDSDLLVQGLENGTVDALVVQDPHRMGYLGVKAIYDHLQQREVETMVDTGVTVRRRPGN